MITAREAFDKSKENRKRMVAVEKCEECINTAVENGKFSTVVSHLELDSGEKARLCKYLGQHGFETTIKAGDVVIDWRRRD